MTNKVSIFKTPEGKEKFLRTYDECLQRLWDKPYETLYAETRFGKTHVLVSGPEDAPPLVLLHGMTFNSIMWYRNLPELNRKYRTYCIDTLGDYGKSETAVPLKSREDCVRWIDEVLDGLKLDRAGLIGHSMGGWLSLNFALARPERVEKLVLLAPIMSVQRLPLKFMFKVYPVMARPTREKILKLWTWFLAEGNRLDKEIEEIIVQGWLHCRPQMKVVPCVFKREEMSGLQPRTLFLAGDQEVVYRALKAVARIRELVPGIRADIIPHSNHCFIAEQYESVNAKIMDFLAEG
ncbi:alpha/beta fold hydrolase [Cohnella caldifontis]|uniref:alpha/beta fold hydrolase n=1 Tax=Cohnella caldifontis TaxID=3027471 RepID=UPI0023EB782D|nr:alpha/beta hydrolase [Cohnella sp. YIM B05605]